MVSKSFPILFVVFQIPYLRSMEIRFQSKEESNREQEEEFLKLSGAERFFAFLELSRAVMRQFTQKDQQEDDLSKTHFVIERKKHK